MDSIEEIRGPLLLRKVSDVTVARKYSAGLSLRNIARQLGVVPNTVRNSLKRSGIPLRKRGGRKATRCRECGKPPRPGRGLCDWHCRLENARRMANHYSRRKQAHAAAIAPTNPLIITDGRQKRRAERLEQHAAEMRYCNTR